MKSFLLKYDTLSGQREKIITAKSEKAVKKIAKKTQIHVLEIKKIKGEQDQD